MSETQNIATQSQNDDKKQEKKGLKLAGYVIPWWVVLVAVLILAYVAYDNGMLNVFCNPNPKKEFSLNLFNPATKAKAVPLPALLPQFDMNQSLQVPQNLRNLFQQ